MWCGVIVDALVDWPSYTFQYGYSDICLVASYTTSSRHYPVVYGSDSRHFYFPEQAECTVLYQADDGYQLARVPFDTSNYNWTKFWED